MRATKKRNVRMVLHPVSFCGCGEPIRNVEPMYKDSAVYQCSTCFEAGVKESNEMMRVYQAANKANSLN